MTNVRPLERRDRPVHSHLARLKPRVYNPWELDMTLCIAAVCKDDAYGLDSCAVVCFDHRVEVPTASAETGFKFGFLSLDWTILKAGCVPLTSELETLYRDHLNSTTIDESNVLEELRIPAHRFRERRAEALVHSRLAISYADFLAHGKDWLPAKTHEDLMYELQMQFSQAPYNDLELIFVGIVGKYFRIFKLSRWEVEECENFGTIGSGSVSAEGILYQRELRSSVNTPAAAYAVFEASKLSASAPGVGKERTVLMLRKNEIRGYSILACDYRVLERQFRKFAPRKYVAGGVTTKHIFPAIKASEE
jgi:hypothetical protein